MYSLRTHVATALWEGKATSTIGFYFLKKEEVPYSQKYKVDFADLKNTKDIQHDILYVPFMMLDIMDSVFKEFKRSYSTLTDQVYFSPADFRKITLQVVSSMSPETSRSKCNDLFRGVFSLLNDNNAIKSKSFSKMIKPFLRSEDTDKSKELYKDFREKFERLQKFCNNQKIIVKRSERVYEALKYNLEWKAKEAFIASYLNNEKYSEEDKDKIAEILFNNAIVVLGKVEAGAIVETKSVKKKKKVKKEVVVQIKAAVQNPYVSYEEEFGSFLDTLMLEAEKKEKCEKVKKIQESLLIKAKMKLLNQNGEGCKEDVLLYDIHTDASLNENRAGFGAVVCSVNLENLQAEKLVVKMAGMKQIGAEGKLSTQIAELIAIQSIVKHMEDIKNQTGKDILFRVYSDNQGCVDALQGKPIWESNATIRKILQDIKTSPVRLMYAFEKGHVGNKWNEEAHKLSRYGRRFTEEKFVRV